MQTVFPYFQAIISVASGRIVGYEALAGHTKQRQLISDETVTVPGTAASAEQTRELDRQVRWLALQKFSVLEDKTSYITLNISAANIDCLNNVKQLPTIEMLEKLNIDRSRVIIEIADGEAEIGKLKEAVKLYRQHGLRVAVDHYGSGYSQLDRVIALNPDIIKIDMRLFKKAAKGGVAASEAVQLLTRFGKRQGYQIICEGVESMHEFFFGLSCGAQYMQGHLFSAAELDFKSPDFYQQHIASLRNKFLTRNLANEQKKLDRFSKIERLAYKLKEALQHDFNLNELSSWGFEDLGVLKFYLCNSSGEQISPDFNFKNNHWYSDAKKMGHNWSWRSYCYQTIALNNCGINNRVVISDSYRDYETGVLCKTLSLYLDSERMLMIDMKNEVN